MPLDSFGGAFSFHFCSDELACRHCGVNLCKQELVDALEALRADIGGIPITIDDAYRCPEHNADVGGVPGSQHQLGIAADISIPGWTGAQLEAAALRIPAFRDGGIGRNDFRNYIHVDVRDVESRWCYDAHGAWCKYYPPGQKEISK